MSELDELCPCGSGNKFRDCCHKQNSIVDLTQYKFDQAEKELRLKLVDFSHRPDIQAQIGEAFYIWKSDPDILDRDIREEDIDDLVFSKFFDWFMYDFKLLSDGKRIIERFYEEETDDLSDLEYDVLDDWMENLYSFFDVEEVFPKEGCRIRDIFTGELFEVKDAASSQQISTSNIVAGRPLRTGKHYYFSAVILVYPAAFKPLIIDFFNREFKEYRRSYGRDKTSKDYLKDWGFLLGKYIEDTLKQQRFLTPEGDNLVLASATYAVEDYGRVLKGIRQIGSFQEVPGGTDELRLFYWVKRDGNAISGTIELESDFLTIECYSENLLAKAKNLVEKKLTGAVIHKKDKTRQLESLGRSKKPSRSRKARKPASRGEKSSPLDEYYEGWIDKPHKVLRGQTPRQATQSKQGRERLNSILEELESLYYHARERGEPYYDVVKLRKKLRLE